MSVRDASCEDRISEHLESRSQHLAALRAVVLAPHCEDGHAQPAATDLHESGEIDSPLTCDPDELAEQAQDRMRELPLAVSSFRTFRIDLSTGGPADWLEVKCSGDTPNYEMAEGDGEHYEVEEITYHFADWFDHAEQVLESGTDEFEAFEAFALEVVPELMG